MNKRRDSVLLAIGAVGVNYVSKMVYISGGAGHSHLLHKDKYLMSFADFLSINYQ